MSSKKRSKKSNKKNSYNYVRRPESLRGVRPDKKLGQNFLIDEDVIQAIIDGSRVNENSLVLEIGPGTGALTLPLAERAGRVIAIELDDDMIEGLRIKTFGMDNVEILKGDILETDIRGITQAAMKEYGLSELRIIGNLPYYITTPIIMKLLEEVSGAKAIQVAQVAQGTGPWAIWPRDLSLEPPEPPEPSITVMMQKEVGDRIAAEPGTRASGAITYPVHYHAEVTELVDVPRECFYPVPGVDSVVLRLDLREKPAVRVRDEKLLFDCVKAGFSMRRKTLHNSLTALGGYDKERLSDALERAGIDPGRRAETLTLEEFARLADSLQEA